MAHHTLPEAFDVYLDELAPKLEHADRVSGFKDYCYGLMLFLPRKSIDPIAASVNPAPALPERYLPRGHITHLAQCE